MKKMYGHLLVDTHQVRLVLHGEEREVVLAGDRCDDVVPRRARLRAHGLARQRTEESDVRDVRQPCQPRQIIM